MKSYGLALTTLIFVFVLTGCAATTQVQRSDSFSIDSDFESVWSAALASINEMGFTIRNTEKSSGFIFAQGGRSALTQNEAPQMNISIAAGQEGHSVVVTVTAVQPGQLVDYGASSRNAQRFREVLESRFLE